MLQRLPIALAQVKAGNNSGSLSQKSIQQHNRIYSIKFHATYKRWILY